MEEVVLFQEAFEKMALTHPQSRTKGENIHLRFKFKNTHKYIPIIHRHVGIKKEQAHMHTCTRTDTRTHARTQTNENTIVDEHEKRIPFVQKTLGFGIQTL